ncbi:hypothetical protein Q7P37_005753 [Cladosporium fusiforme]
MATTDGPLPDALVLLRSSIADSNLPLPSVNQEATAPEQSLAAASYLVFNQNGQHTPIPLTQETRFISAALGERPIDLRSVFFCWQNRDKGTGDYIAATQALNGELSGLGKQETVTNLVFVEKLDLVNWLSGESGEEESEFIKSLDNNVQTRAEARDAAATAAGGDDVEMRDAGISDAAARKREEERLREIYALERKMGDRNTVLRGVKAQDFSGVRKHSSVFLSKNSKGAPAPNGALNSILPFVRLARAPTVAAQSPSSCFRHPLLAPETASSTAPNLLYLTRLLPSIDSHKPMRFGIVDSPDNFRPDDWKRVVAVFTTGQAWQFKNYKWQAPADLFSHVLGVYVGWTGEMAPDTVKGWGRGVLSVGLDKGGTRWRDREVVEEVWSGIEARMRSMGWTREGPRPYFDTLDLIVLTIVGTDPSRLIPTAKHRTNPVQAIDQPTNQPGTLPTMSLASNIESDMNITQQRELLSLVPHPVTGRLIDSHPGTRTRPMKVLVLGASRTGTMSILTALEHLGYNPYHMVKAMRAPKLNFSLWIEALQAKFHGQGKPWGREEFDKVLGDFDAVEDVSTICFAEELIAAYPDAKIVLSNRDVDKWLASMESTAGVVLRWKSWPWLAGWDPSLAGPWWEHGKAVMQPAYDTFNDFSPASPAREAFHRHYERIRAVAPQERILEYRVQDGWGPLCEFLGVEVPEGVEFPRVNDKEAFVRVHGYMWWLALSRMVGTVALMGLPVVGGLVAFWFRGGLRTGLGRWMK